MLNFQNMNFVRELNPSSPRYHKGGYSTFHGCDVPFSNRVDHTHHLFLNGFRWLLTNEQFEPKNKKSGTIKNVKGETNTGNRLNGNN